MTPRPQTAGLPRWQLALITWLAIYPTITVMLALFEPLGLLNLPLELRTLALTVVLVPLMVFILVPGLTWIALAAQATFGAHGHRPHDPGSPRSTSGSER